MTGLEINFYKSSLVSWSRFQNDVWCHEMAGMLQCNIQSLPFTYLGVPIGGYSRTLKFWEPVLKKHRA